MALALALAPAASYITPSSTLMSKATLSSRFATVRYWHFRERVEQARLSDNSQ